MFEFEWMWVFLLLPLPWLVSAMIPATGSSGAALKSPYFETWLKIQDQNKGKTVLPRKSSFLMIAAWICLIVATAKPMWIGDPISLPVTGRDLMLAIDLSGSMENPDFTLKGDKVDRLTVVKQVAGDFIKRRKGDRIGLILFGKRAYVQTPLTFDTDTVAYMLREAEIGLAGKETAIGDGIGLAVKRLSKRPEGGRVLILLTDGANTAGEIEPLKAAELASTTGLKIYSIGVGADTMDVQTFFGTRRVNPSADLDERTLAKIAAATGGSYFRAKDTESLEQIYSKIDELEPVSEEVETLRPQVSLYYWPLLVFVAIILMYTIVNLKTRTTVKV